MTTNINLFAMRTRKNLDSVSRINWNVLGVLMKFRNWQRCGIDIEFTSSYEPKLSQKNFISSSLAAMIARILHKINIQRRCRLVSGLTKSKLLLCRVTEDNMRVALILRWDMKLKLNDEARKCFDAVLNAEIACLGGEPNFGNWSCRLCKCCEGWNVWGCGMLCEAERNWGFSLIGGRLEKLAELKHGEYE
jgi:hypothetical protein